MDRMKTFGIYALIVILFFIFSNVMINIALKTSYSPINVEIERSKNVDIDITKSVATYVNGYVGGSLKNKGEDIDKIYVKIDLYSKRDVLLGTKYVEVNDFRKNENREFEMGFRLTDVEYANIKLVDKVEEPVSQDNFISENISWIKLLTIVILLCYF